MTIMLVIVGILFGAIFGWKAFVGIMSKRYFAEMSSPTVTVSAMTAKESLWEPTIKSVGSLRARVGVSVTTELAGMVQAIYFKPGSTVKKGEILVQLNADAELGHLHSLQAQVELAKITYQRDKAQYKVHAVSKQTVDADEWTLKNLQAQVSQQKATTDKKTIRAPFDGSLGINNVSPGQYLNVGDTVTTLQALDPIYADFYFPQQALAKLKLGQKVETISDTFPKRTFSGHITTIQPLVDTNTRNVLIEATLSNQDSLLIPGMFVHGTVNLEEQKKYITLPQTAISFNSYGDMVYLIQETDEKGENNKSVLIAKQVFVTLGDTRGDQVAIIKGVKPGDRVVTSGQLKLKNGSKVVVNNSIQPINKADPKVIEK
jgi:membrane fusion protein (multidrug efflux system)